MNFSHSFYFRVVLFDDRLVKSGRLLELILLHEQNVRHVQLPRVILVAELDGFSKDSLHLLVVLHVPVNFSLRHQHRNEPKLHKSKITKRTKMVCCKFASLFKYVFVIVDCLFDHFVIVALPRFLHLFGQLPQRFRVPRGQLVEFIVGVFGRRLLHNQSVQKVKQILNIKL